jgi:hypothetical protein
MASELCRMTSNSSPSSHNASASELTEAVKQYIVKDDECIYEYLLMAMKNVCKYFS